ncbi:hypothetical protein CLOBOL_00529 [Enterocloster bolteae ATCC BAA-613]|uniref:Uncharacterized protein n=1 Tax=Enterocloster bolteae (strain ATCC BAA-613 / DSM 15670 / CCUG 46953 / JCM 12243 / WAL 16351) TaxID=411902 RepID=A8RHX0_ENTBW|nr:hypothetical protein CLOBOL_00529 [Enterocloster bolteae ATCC BAA-613]
METYSGRKETCSADSRGIRAFFSPSGQRSGRQGFPCRPVCEKKLYEKHLLFTNLTIQTNCEGFMVEM